MNENELAAQAKMWGAPPEEEAKQPQTQRGAMEERLGDRLGDDVDADEMMMLVGGEKPQPFTNAEKTQHITEIAGTGNQSDVLESIMDYGTSLLKQAEAGMLTNGKEGEQSHTFTRDEILAALADAKVGDYSGFSRFNGERDNIKALATGEMTKKATAEAVDRIISDESILRADALRKIELENQKVAELKKIATVAIAGSGMIVVPKWGHEEVVAPEATPGFAKAPEVVMDDASRFAELKKDIPVDQLLLLRNFADATIGKAEAQRDGNGQRSTEEGRYMGQAMLAMRQETRLLAKLYVELYKRTR